jgi:RNA polymerase sigma factor (sigma-70 family)
MQPHPPQHAAAAEWQQRVNAAGAPSSEAEFLRLWQQYRDEFFALCTSLMGGNRADAEDALGRALLTALEKFSRYASRIYNPWAWLRRLVFNTCISMLRERQRERRVMLPEPEEQQPEPPTFETPEELFLRQEAMLRLHQLIEELPELLQGPVVLRLLQAKDYSEIAAHFSITEENARKRVQLGRQELQRGLDLYLTAARESSG